MANWRTIRRRWRTRYRDGLLCAALSLGLVSVGAAAGLTAFPSPQNRAAPLPLRAGLDLTQRPIAPLPRDFARRSETSPLASISREPALALVIDDLGQVEAGTRAAIALPGRVTLSFLPYGPNALALSRDAEAAGHEVILHLPMQPVGSEDAGPKALRVDLPPAENIARLHWALARIPGADGVNNHMGSRFTADATALAPVLESLSGQGDFFLDSRTTAKTIVVPLARRLGIPSASRDVFLDDRQDQAYIRHQLDEAIRTARRNGVAIAIGHPHPATLAVLQAWLAAGGARGVQLVPLREAVQLKDGGAIVAHAEPVWQSTALDDSRQRSAP